ncbi:hypothetical protein OHB41_33125 [Streptomyces sp. NBC_01571]|uniref:hypothetical protein n=1 Tax=Streptomyces sp. NBC_01571 TaxID=2975883 RepID=UPI0022595F0A|nr:hypothetical protein [Streptomyces sp. NBC_01571]MCX4577944.1 hypothetical protein [Streptomyces sp. NBC_01571]
MAALTELRKEVAQVLSDAGIRAYEAIPDRAKAPLVIVTPGLPYLTPSQQFGEHAVTVKLEIMCLVDTGTNPKVSADLDAYVEQVYLALADADFDVDEVSAPYAMESTNYLGSTIRITSNIVLGGTN